MKPKNMTFEQGRFVAEPKPEEPDLGYKPLVLIDAEAEWEETKKTDFYKSYQDEFCMWCSSLIGKDYGSHNHSCEALELGRRYYKPKYEYQSNLREWDDHKTKVETANRLLDLGLEPDDAEHLASGTLYHKDIVFLLDHLDKRGS